jgi:hypothetical protein
MTTESTQARIAHFNEMASRPAGLDRRDCGDLVATIRELTTRLTVAQAFIEHQAYCGLTKEDALAACDLEHAFGEEIC